MERFILQLLVICGDKIMGELRIYYRDSQKILDYLQI